MTLPLLVPRPRRPIAPVVPAPQLVPTHKEWAALYSEIEQLYVRKRRKLRYIKQYMERKHGLKATEQMYKKRFAKWGFQKNSSHSSTTTPTLMDDERKKGVSRKHGQPRELGSVPALPAFGHDEGLMLMFLTSVRICSVAFFEPMRSHNGLPASQQKNPRNQPGPEQTNKICFTFKLIMDLLDRGHGNLAGRMARKAFLLVEDMLTLEEPALVWNLIEMMHHMVALRHSQLFQMLLAHLTALVDGRMPKTHPISAMLRGLRGLVAGQTSMVSTSGSSVPTSSSPLPPSPSTRANEATTPASSWPLSHTSSSLLERAWTLNAEIVFNHFDPRLFSLYCHINWSSCSIAPPAAIISIANEGFNNFEAQQTSRLASALPRVEGTFDDTIVEMDRILEHLLVPPPRMDSSPPRDLEILYASSIAALREYRNSKCTKGSSFTGDTTILLRILAVLVTTNILEEWSVFIPTSIASSEMMKVSRVHAGMVASAMRTLMDIKPEHRVDGLITPSEAVDRIRSIVALREYAHTETDPQVVREMWLLADALVRAGIYEEAQVVEQTVFCRLEKYVQDIPLNSA
ncbi:hypothetical protein DV736_g6301, partial [Chaetothyriales sp. CBS 134916]